MSKVKQKELEKLKQQKEKLNRDFENALRRLISGEETMQITLDYCRQYFASPFQESLEEYSPVHISRQVFEKELQKIRKQMSRMPEQQVRIQHFIVLMLKTLKIPFEKSPLYMVGLKDMFHEIAPEGKDSVTYDDIFKYLVGELIIMKDQQQDTEFQGEFIENKKQDFLLHDNGIKKVYYSNDLKTVLSLDYRESTIKIYDQQMRNITRFSPKKQMHGGKMPQIVDFDYSEMTMRLGVIFSDSTIESINLPNFINKSEAEFDSTTLNQLLFPLPKLMKKIVYIHMINKFLTFSDELDELYLFDMEKVRLKPQEVQQRISIDTNEMAITDVLEVVSLSLVCVVAGNEVTFLSENLKDQKCSKFIHHDTIEHLKFVQQKSTFYLSCLYERTITMFTINRSRTSFKISSFSIDRVIVDFQVFPLFDTILIVDEKHDVRLIHEVTRKTFKEQSFSHIVKAKNQNIHCCKTGKSEYLIYQTYLLGFTLEKVAIQRETELNFLDYWHYDSKKEEFYFSLNDQLICFSLLFGDLRKNYNSDSSNLSKHEAFFLGKNTHPFLIDESQSLYELYLKSELQGQNKFYKKRLQARDIVGYFYDDEMRNVMAVTSSSIVQVRNDSNNSFSSINTINLVGFQKVTSARFCKQSKYLTFMTSDSLLFQLQNFQTHIGKAFQIQFVRQKNQVASFVLDYHYCSELQVVLLLNSNRELYIFQKNEPSNYVVLNLVQLLPYSLRATNFTKIYYTLFKEKGRNHPSVVVYDETGYILDINLQQVYVKAFSGKKKEEFLIKSFQKESYDIARDKSEVEIVVLSQEKKMKLSPSEFTFQKVHDKQISIISKLKVQIPAVLTISKDGFLKLWNSKYQNLFSLKLPNLLKTSWNMQEIHTLKNNKSIAEIKEIIEEHYCKGNQRNSEQILSKTKKLKNMTEFPKKYKFQEELPLEIDSKEVEDIVKKEENYMKLYMSSRVNRPKIKFNPEKTQLDSHPWRTRREFVKIFQRASPPNKYSKTIPKNLLTLRKSLDMTERKVKKETYEAAEIILPLLKTYENEKPNDPQSAKKKARDKEVDEFQSCIYVRSQRPRKRLNELDQIDRQFMRKQIENKHRRFSSRFRGDDKSMTIDLSESTQIIVEQNRYDTIRDIRSVFEQHNKECVEQGRGRIIKIPDIRKQSQKMEEQIQS